MRQRNWLFYKVMLYLGLIGSICLIGILIYTGFSNFGSYWHKVTVSSLLLAAGLQTIFYVLCIRLVHRYIPNRAQPGKAFNIIYTILLIFNSCIAISFLLLLAFGFSETFLQGDKKPTPEDYSALLIIGGYTFTTIYISTASIVLRRYNRYQAATDEEKWLNELGSSSND